VGAGAFFFLGVGGMFILMGLLYYGSVREDRRLGEHRPGKSSSQGYTNAVKFGAPLFTGLGLLSVVTGLIFLLVRILRS
jgi:hypothetical protein